MASASDTILTIRTGDICQQAVLLAYPLLKSHIGDPTRCTTGFDHLAQAYNHLRDQACHSARREGISSVVVIDLDGNLLAEWSVD